MNRRYCVHTEKECDKSEKWFLNSRRNNQHPINDDRTSDPITKKKNFLRSETRTIFIIWVVNFSSPINGSVGLRCTSSSKYYLLLLISHVVSTPTGFGLVRVCSHISSLSYYIFLNYYRTVHSVYTYIKRFCIICLYKNMKFHCKDLTHIGHILKDPGLNHVLHMKITLHAIHTHLCWNILTCRTR
jgi:hypothetical protein